MRAWLPLQGGAKRGVILWLWLWILAGIGCALRRHCGGIFLALIFLTFLLLCAPSLIRCMGAILRSICAVYKRFSGPLIHQHPVNLDEFLLVNQSVENLFERRFWRAASTRQTNIVSRYRAVRLIDQAKQGNVNAALGRREAAGSAKEVGRPEFYEWSVAHNAHPLCVQALSPLAPSGCPITSFAIDGKHPLYGWMETDRRLINISCEAPEPHSGQENCRRIRAASLAS